MTEQTRVAETTEDQVPSAPVDAPSAPRPVVADGAPARARVRPSLAADLAALGGLVALLAFLWGRAWGTWFWLDEGISAGISSHALRSIPKLLREDGSPPLYYGLLHAWMSLFGSADARTHLLSLVFALAVVPAALWAGWSLFGRRTGWMCALLAALNPFLAFYATETRMYSLVVLLALLTTATFLHAFVFRRRGHVVTFALALALLLYTHNWGLFLAVGAAIALVPCFFLSTDRRRFVADAALGFGAVALLYAPWVPTLVYQQGQASHPWTLPPTLLTVRDDVAQAFGGLEGVVALGLGSGVALTAMLRRPRSRTAVAVVAVAVLPFVVLAAGWASRVWAYRYLAVVVAPLLLLLAIGLARGGRIAVAALAVAAFVSAPIAVKSPLYQKSNARAVAEQASARLRPGDLVISPDLQMVPLLANYLRPGLRYATTLGLVPDERIVDWRHSLQRLQRSDPAATLAPLLDALPPGRHVLVACPPTTATSESTGLAQGPANANDAQSTQNQQSGPSQDTANASQSVPPPDGVSAFHDLILVRCREVNHMARTDPRLRLDETLKAPTGVAQTPVDGYLFTKLG